MAASGAGKAACFDEADNEWKLWNAGASLWVAMSRPSNVVDIGRTCVGTGTPDDRACIQAAITAAGTNGVLLVPTGKSYRINSTLNFTGLNMAVIGYGGFAESANFDCQTDGTPCFDFTAAAYVTLRNITITGKTTEGAPSTTVASGLNNTTNPVTFTVASNSGWPAAAYYIQVQSEILKVTSKSGTSWTASRAQFGTTNASHADATAVAQWKAPNIGILMARPLGGASCGPFHVVGAHLTGYFSLADVYNYGCEANRWDFSHISNQVDTGWAYAHIVSNALGITSAFTTIASGTVSNTHGTFTGGSLNNYASTCTQSEAIYFEGGGDVQFENMSINACGTRVIKLSDDWSRIAFKHIVSEPTGGGTPTHFVENMKSTGTSPGLITENVGTTTTDYAYYAASAGFADCRILAPYVGGGAGARLVQATGLIGCVIEYPVNYGGRSTDLVKTTSTTQSNVFLAGKADDWVNIPSGSSYNIIQRQKTTTIGFVQTGHWPPNASVAFFGNNQLDQTSSGNYGVQQTSTGDTAVNAASGKAITARINNATKTTWDANGFTVGTGTAINSLRWAATASVADGGSITHGLGGTPTACLTTLTVANEIGAVTALSSTTFTVAIKKRSDGTAGTTQTIYWQCLK